MTAMSRYLAKSQLDLGGADEVLGSGHWRYGLDGDGIGWLLLNREDSSVNTISEEVLRELETHLAQIESALPKAVVIRSSKSSGFAAGADINALASMGEEDATTLLTQAHAIMDRLAGLTCPTIAVVHGAALGAGFELALACDHRIAIRGASFGLPEVRLGLHPGLGGTIRLPDLIEPTAAMRMMLTGSTVHTKKAQDTGIVDAVVEERHLRAAIRSLLHGDSGSRSASLMSRALQLQSARRLAADRMRRETEKKAPQIHYPAPHALIEMWAERNDDPAATRRAEIASFAHLLQTETSKKLIRAFFLRQTLKAAASESDDISDVHVVGAGIMGAEIAAWAAMQGKSVTVTDPDKDALGRMVKKARELCKDAHKDSLETRDALDRLMPDPLGYGAARADLVIEAGPEKPELKQKIFDELGKRMKTGAILATNTSSLELSQFVKLAPVQAQFAGLHFFNPVSKVPLVEVVSHDKTGKSTRDRLMAFCTSIDRLPVAVKDAPGFLVNRALMPYLLEALILLDEGISKERIDSIALGFGMPMGPVTLADQVGLDICLDVAESLRGSLDTPMPDIPHRLREKVELGETGRKVGRGFYDWSDGPPDPQSQAKPDDELVDRLFLPMLNACAECLRKGVVGSADELDAAMIFATGFAPFRGGPLHYARKCGHDRIADRLEELRKSHGDRFTPDPYWRVGA